MHRRLKRRVVAHTLRFYLDENMPTEVARQLRARGIEAVTARDSGLLGALDEDHLTVAVTNGYVLCT
jgi:predicted nuclease of predicted toxin-antitoxin system